MKNEMMKRGMVVGVHGRIVNVDDLVDVYEFMRARGVFAIDVHALGLAHNAVADGLEQFGTSPREYNDFERSDCERNDGDVYDAVDVIGEAVYGAHVWNGATLINEDK